MKKFIRQVFGQAPQDRVEFALCFLRVGIGILTIPHGYPKIMGGVATWQQLGSFMHPLGIYFLPTMWGFLGAFTEFAGGIALVLGLGTRIASSCLSFMMFVAAVWHIQRGDAYCVSSFPISLIVVFVAFIMLGSGKYSVDYYLLPKKAK